MAAVIGATGEDATAVVLSATTTATTGADAAGDADLAAGVGAITAVEEITAADKRFI